MLKLKIFLKFKDMKNDAAVLLIAFGRVDYARKTFEAIKAAKPSKFYFYTNAGRPDHPDECRRNDIVKSMAKEVDWPCEFKTWFREEPVGVLDSIRLAINWVFENEEKAIVMEEDCVGAPAWFTFANEMLEMYKDEKRIWMIGGSNYAEGYNPLGYSYHFSRNFFINGWASWRDRWQKVDWEHLDYLSILKEGVIDSYYPTTKERNYHKDNLKRNASVLAQNKCWDFAFWYTAVANNAYSITPSYHLVQNIGVEGVHQGPLGRLQLLLGNKLQIPYNPITFTQDILDSNNQPKFLHPNAEFDKKVYKNWLGKENVWYIKLARKVYHKLKGE